MNKLILSMLAWAIVSLAVSIGIATAVIDVHANDNRIVFQEYPTLVKCYDYSTGLMHKPVKGSCLIGKTMKNVYLPSAYQMRIFKEAYVTREYIYAPLAIANWESQFDINARSCNEYACASGIMQITDANGGLSMDTYEQLKWFADRKEYQITKWTCSNTAATWNHEKLLRCVFARHYGTLDFYGKYVNEKMDMYEFYKELLEGKELVF